MNNLCADTGYQSLNKWGESLCGDHVDVVSIDDTSQVIVLADGLGSGVKASILSTLTAKMISTMASNNLDMEDIVRTVAATLPVCSVRDLAYSTFTVIKIVDNKEAYIIEYDNPRVVFFRDNEHEEIAFNSMQIDDKTIHHAHIYLQENDMLFVFSDGALYAGVGQNFNFGWQRKEIIDFLKLYIPLGFTANTLATMLTQECNKLYDGKPGDDTTVCAVKIIPRQPLNIVVGPPSNADDDDLMMSLFFSKAGKKIVCGGTTSKIVGEYLDKPVVPQLTYHDSEIPPIATIEGVDLVTEGVITINKVLYYVQDYMKDNLTYEQWSYKKDGASQMTRLLLEESTDINFFVGKAINPAHQNPELPIQFNIKMRLVEQLSQCLKDLGKKVKISYF